MREGAELDYAHSLDTCYQDPNLLMGRRENDCDHRA
jgi:hypothetical protein